MIARSEFIVNIRGLRHIFMKTHMYIAQSNNIRDAGVFPADAIESVCWAPGILVLEYTVML